MKQIFFLFLMSCFWVTTYAETPQGNTPNDSLYRDAFQKIKAMLKGENSMSFKKAVFLTENAFLDGGLSPHTFDIEIQFLANLAMEVANQEQLKYKFEDSTNIQKNWSLTRIFMDTFDVNFRGESKQWLPPQYHFDDPLGQKDWKNTFVSQLLKTGRGNCHSLPFLYKILAEETGTAVSLALAPSHIYLKASSKNHKIGGYNIELTGKGHPIDGWIVTTSYISTDAIRSNLYMDDLNLKESIVLTLLDLAQGYENKFPNADEEFVLMCIEEALKHFPDCVNAHLLKMEFLVNRYKVNQDKVIREQIGEECKWLLERGYDEMPKEMYADGLTTPSRYKQNSQTYITQNEQEANPYGFGITPTLTKGRYLETHTKDEVERIGSVLFNRKTGQVESIEEAQKIGDLTMSSATVGRFLSVDPLTAKFPFYTPYQFAGNKPIRYVDLEGLQEGDPMAEAAQIPAITLGKAWEGANNAGLWLSSWIYPKGGQVNAIRNAAEQNGLHIPAWYSDDDVYNNYKLRYTIDQGYHAVQKEGAFNESIQTAADFLDIAGVYGGGGGPIAAMKVPLGWNLGSAAMKGLKSIPLRARFADEVLEAGYTSKQIDFNVQGGKFTFEGMEAGKAYSFVIKNDGTLRLGMDRPGVHFNLSDGAESVSAAGKVTFKSNGTINTINNSSGHYGTGVNLSKEYTNNVINTFEGAGFFDEMEVIRYGKQINDAKDF